MFTLFSEDTFIYAEPGYLVEFKEIKYFGDVSTLYFRYQLIGFWLVKKSINAFC